MIYIILGTIGEYVKMLPVMREFDDHKIEYQFIHTSQRYEIIEKTRKIFGAKKPDVYLTSKKSDLKSIKEAIFWALKVLYNSRKLEIKKNDFVVIHGNAESSLLGFIIGKIRRAKIVHVESGLKSNLFEPFPETFIRLFISRLSDICFCPEKQALENLKNKKGVYDTKENTVLDAIRLALKQKPSEEIKKLKKTKYVLFSIRRKENLLIKSRLTKILDLLENILQKGYLVIFLMHPNTKYEIEQRQLWNSVENMQKIYKLEIKEFINYVDLIYAVKNTEFIASDSNGLQMESYYLNRPDLLLAKSSQGNTGIGETAYLSYLDKKRFDFFLNNYKSFKRKTKIKGSPSKIILDFFEKNLI